MTKKQRRDKESSAESHRKKINGRRSSIAGERVLSRSCRGIVNLARRRPQGKVLNKARILVDSLPVVFVHFASRSSRIFNELCEVWRSMQLPYGAPCQYRSCRESDPCGNGSRDVSSQDLSSASGAAWRDELAARLSRYRERRKAPPPRYPSLRLPFDRIEAKAVRSYLPALTSSRHSSRFRRMRIALDGMQQMTSAPEPSYLQAPPAEERAPACTTPAAGQRRQDHRVSPVCLGATAASARPVGGAG